MAELKMTANRLALLRAIDNYEVWTVEGSGCAWRRPNAPYGRDRDVTARVNELRDAGLVAVRPDEEDLDIQGFGLTDAGRQVLASADTKEN
jgi:hypothetical protein